MKEYRVLRFNMFCISDVLETIEEVNELSAEQGYEIFTVITDSALDEQYLLLVRNVPKTSK